MSRFVQAESRGRARTVAAVVLALAGIAVLVVVLRVTWVGVTAERDLIGRAAACLVGVVLVGWGVRWYAGAGKRAAVVTATAAIVVGVVAILLVIFPVVWPVPQTGEVASYGWFLILWVVDPAFAVALITVGVVLIAGSIVLLLLSRRNTRPRLRRVVSGVLLCLLALVLAAVGWPVIEVTGAAP